MATVWSIAAAVIASIGGGAALVWGLSNFLGKVWANRILEQDRLRYQTELEHIKDQFNQAARKLQAQIDKTTYVHRLHFETEFAALKDAWRDINKLCDATSLLGPHVSQAIESFEPQYRGQHEAKRSEAIRDATGQVANVMTAHWPFITDTIQTKLLSTTRAAAKVIDLYQKKQNEQVIAAALTLMEGERKALVDAIRARLDSLALIPESKDGV